MISVGVLTILVGAGLAMSIAAIALLVGLAIRDLKKEELW